MTDDLIKAEMLIRIAQVCAENAKSISGGETIIAFKKLAVDALQDAYLLMKAPSKPASRGD